MKGESQKIRQKAPEFDSSILHPAENEIVRAVCTLPNQEATFEKYCHSNGVVVYLPLRRIWRVRNVNSNGKQYSYSHEVLRPLFPSYAFVKTEEAKLRDLYASRAIARILMVHDQPRLLKELQLVRTCELVGFEQELEIHNDITEGSRFLITSGIWNGVEGRLSKKDDTCKWTVEIEMCQQYVTTVIDPTQFKMTPLDD